MIATSDYCCITEQSAREIRSHMPRDTEVETLAELFRVLGDATRIRLLSILESQPMCVKDLAAVVGMQQTAVSHQLKVLRHNRLVRCRREGKMAIYSLDDDHVASLFTVGLEHVKGE